MGVRKNAFRAPMMSLGLVTAAVLCLGAGAPLQAQGQYAPVTDEDVLAMRLNHYFTAEKKGREADFEWRFFKDGFVLKSGRGSIPADLQEKLVKKGASADDISGKWAVASKSGQLLLTDIQVGKKPTQNKASFRIYRTAPTVIRVGNPQYVFGIEP